MVDGETYVKRSSLAPALPKGPRVILVIDRGWVFAGDLVYDGDFPSRIFLDNALHVFSWCGGFPLLVSDPKAAKADLRKIVTRVDVPESSEVFRVPVESAWGTK